ncbi:CAP domain-containing protein [Pilimelia columellifera]|uniref:SCP domain-containing protein n=1 Tax=Pilimelia columellifera subsp. columellifera TaxID=706583 RepID=A0ABN3N4L1_9ACTN
MARPTGPRPEHLNRAEMPRPRRNDHPDEHIWVGDLNAQRGHFDTAAAASGHRARHVAPRQRPWRAAGMIGGLLALLGAVSFVAYSPTDAEPMPVAADAPPAALAPGGGAGAPADAGTPTPRTPASARAAAPAAATPARQPTTSRTRTLQRRPNRPARPVTNGGGKTAIEDKVTALINKEREANGCDAARTDEKLRAASRAHSADMALHGYFDHTSKDGRSPWDRAKAAGYEAPTGENIAKGHRTPELVVQGWMDSPGHRANILNCKSKATAVGLAYDSGDTPLWTQMFGAR